MDIQIVFENNDLLAINKPAGIMVHPDGKSENPTLVDWILEKYPELKGIGEPLTIDGKVIDRPGIVHRLDKETSGALLLAKNQDSFLFFKKQFQDRLIQKEYHAFVWGHFKEPVTTITAPIGRNKNDFRKWQAGRGIRGETREALTQIKAVQQFEEKGEQFSFIHAFPKTGRTHQIRVHLSYMQRPIVCDSLYGDYKPAALGFSRLALHARLVTFLLPSGEQKTVVADYPAEFNSALAKYGVS